MASETKRTAPDMDAIIANAKKEGKLKTVALNWKEVYYTNCCIELEGGLLYQLSVGICQ
ncbi:MAG: hypothetical protein H6Q24_1563 [Bacteroidetes bacterium]|nr:hypothetical protein [Bacteroidota bacterium]